MNNCHLCQAQKVTQLLDVGPQPISNRYTTEPAVNASLYPMVIGQCSTCGLIQMLKPVPASELLPAHKWIKYNEPEEHLNHMVDIVAKLPDIQKSAQICGISFKDDSTLDRLQKLGFKHNWRIDPNKDLNINNTGAGIETIQSSLVPATAKKMVIKHGQSDIIIARHILEHTHYPQQFIEALKQLLKPNGYIVFEVPDCTQAIDNFDYTTLWEEHTLYFTPNTFQSGLAFAGFPLINIISYPYPFENSLVGVVQLNSNNGFVNQATNNLESELDRAKRFADTLPEKRFQLKNYFTNHSGNIALFGAGHLACTYICVMELEKYIEFVVDDDPNKSGLFMPGSGLPIYGSSALIEKNIRICLLSLNPLSEEKVMCNNQAFLNNQGAFYSIFPRSKYALKV